MNTGEISTYSSHRSNLSVVQNQHGLESQKMQYFGLSRQELLRKGFTLFDSDIPRGRKIEKPRVYVEGDIEADTLTSQLGPVIIQGSVNGTYIKSKEDIFIRDGAVRKAFLHAPEHTIYVQGNVEAGSKLVGKKIVIEGSVAGSLLLGNSVDVLNITGTQVYGKTINIGKTLDRYGENLIICHTLDYESLISDIKYTHEKESELVNNLHATELKIIEISNTLGDVSGASAYLQAISPKIKQRVELTLMELTRVKRALKIMKQAKDIETLRSLKAETSKRVRDNLGHRDQLMESLNEDQ